MSRVERRTPLNKERVLRAAVELADEEGIDALSMRNLARRLGVEAMSLYNHVANKDEILTGIIDAVAAEIELPPERVGWKTALRRNAISARDVFVRHSWASGLWMSKQSGGPARMRNTDFILRKLREAGFSDALIFHAFHILEAYILGFIRLNLSVAHIDDLPAKAAEFVEQLPADEYPDLVEHVRQHVDPPHGGKGGFELGLDLILDGLERQGRKRRAR